MTDILSGNLAVIADRDAALAERIAKVEPSTALSIRSSRSGRPVPLVRWNGKLIPLHSLVDPVREATRLHDALMQQPAERTSLTGGAPGYLLFEGLGAAYQIRPYLASHGMHHAIVVESDATLLKELLSKLDLTDILSDRRVHLLLDPTAADLAEHIRESYLPAVMGGFQSLPLRSRVHLAQGFFERRRAAARAAIGETADDLTVQSSFGRRWMANILANLRLLAAPATSSTTPITESIVTAAGPSLEYHLGEIERLREGRYLIATDTTLPTLLASGSVPDAVLTIDCQHLSYHHYLAGLPAATTLFVELSAPPLLARLAHRTVAVCGGHPLEQLIARRFAPAIRIDTSGGNVGHAAVSLALELGAQRVHLFGADFAYPSGKPYARGTYVYSFYTERQVRTAPMEGGIAGLMYRDSSLQRQSAGGRFQYATQTMLAYRKRFEQRFHPRAERHASLPGGTFTVEPAVRPNRTPAGYHGTTSDSIDRFLSEYRDAVARLPDGIPDLLSASYSSDPQRAATWETFTTIYPIIAWIRRRTNGSKVEALVSQAKELALQMIDRGTTHTGVNQ